MLTRATHLGKGKFSIIDVSDEHERAITPEDLRDGASERNSAASTFLLGAIASCFGQAVLHAADRLGMDEPGSLTLSVEGAKDKEHFQLGGITITIEARAAQEDLEVITDMAKSYCFVSNSLTCPVKHVVIARS